MKGSEEKITYDNMISNLRNKHKSVFDISLPEWTEPKYNFTNDTQDNEFVKDMIPIPDKEEVGRWIQSSLIRPVPYPYYRALSIPSDNCASNFQDLYYSHMIVDKVFGLDVTSSFYVYNSVPGSNDISLLTGNELFPMPQPVEIEGKIIDKFFLFLSMYNKGWIDHIHSWSSGIFHTFSVIEPVSITLDNSGEYNLDIKPVPSVKTACAGFVIELNISEKIDYFEIQLEDTEGVNHYIVWNKELNGRQGWDLTPFLKTGLGEYTLLLKNETNQTPLSGFGNTNDSSILNRGTLFIKGQERGTLQIQSLKLVESTTGMIQGQLDFMKSFNILPTVITSHGNISSWYELSPFIDTGYRTITNPFSKIAEEILRKPYGDMPSSPSHFSHLLPDYGIIHLNSVDYTGLSEPSVATLDRKTLMDGTNYYYSRRCCYIDTKNFTYKTPLLSKNLVWSENAGVHIHRYLETPQAFGTKDILYTHLWLLGNDGTNSPSPVFFRDIKKYNQETFKAFNMLADLKYNLNNNQWYQRIWVPPLSTLMRFSMTQKYLAQHTERTDNKIYINEWIDPVDGNSYPSSNYATQDLHGQTFYVDNSKTARLFIGSKETKSFKRNIADFTHRESITVVDTSHPTIVFDEVDLYETNGRIFQNRASYFLQHREPYTGEYSMEIQSEVDGNSFVSYFPFRLDNQGTDFIRFAYKKTNSKSRVVVEFITENGRRNIITEDPSISDGWVAVIPNRPNTDYSEVIVEYSDMEPRGEVVRSIPRGQIREIRFGLLNAEKGDSVFFDSVEFLSARGVRPSADNTFMVGGRLWPNIDGIEIRLEINNVKHQAITSRGGWYYFKNIPNNCLAQITVLRDGREFYPVQGRVIQIKRNHLDIDILTSDPRSNSIPIELNDNLKVDKHYAPTTDCSNSTITPKQVMNDYGSVFGAHCRRCYWGQVGRNMDHIVEDSTNNFGWTDKDRRFKNTDSSFRILILGNCWTQGQQVTTSHTLNIFLESFLRRKYGINVEVINASTSSGNLGRQVHVYDKYGHQFKPDLILLFPNAHNFFDTSPELNKLLNGWDPQHPAEFTYDFDSSGNLVSRLPDPSAPIFMAQSDTTPLINNVPFLSSFFAIADYPKIMRRAILLHNAIIKDFVYNKVKSPSQKVAIVYGYIENIMLNEYAKKEGKIFLAKDRYMSEVLNTCRYTDTIPINLNTLFSKSDDMAVFLFPSNAHPTPTAHYQIANLLAQQIERLSVFTDFLNKPSP
jgi:hypothetical protein